MFVLQNLNWGQNVSSKWTASRPSCTIPTPWTRSKGRSDLCRRHLPRAAGCPFFTRLLKKGVLTVPRPASSLQLVYSRSGWPGWALELYDPRTPRPAAPSPRAHDALSPWPEGAEWRPPLGPPGPEGYGRGGSRRLAGAVHLASCDTSRKGDDNESTEISETAAPLSRVEYTRRCTAHRTQPERKC